jgi:ferredoxin--NADP+ reductase
MATILEARTLGPAIRYFRVSAPKIARRQRPGQFVIVRVMPRGERIPLTIADAGGDWIALIVQAVGRTTGIMSLLEAGDELEDLVGPLGTPSEIDRYGTVVIVGGGVGTAIAYPTARALVRAGNRVIAIIGGRTRDHVILEDELRASVDDVLVTTDDGSYGTHGFVTDVLEQLVTSDEPPDRVLAIGPIAMMRAVAEVTRPDGIPTVVSLNPIMVDGTGMCGGCRVRIGDQTRFACVDGPEFDAHLVDFDLLARRNGAYAEFERHRTSELVALTGVELGGGGP